MDFVEGGWPGSNPRDLEYFEEVKKLRLRHAQDRGLLQHLEGRRPVRPGRRRDYAVPAAGGDGACRHRRQELGPAREGRLRVCLDTNLKMIDADHTLPERAAAGPSSSTRSTSSTATRATGVCGEGREGGRRRGGGRGRALRYERGQHALRDRRPRGRGAERRARFALGIHCHNDTEKAVANTPHGGAGRRASTCRARSTATGSAAATPTSVPSSRTSSSRWAATARTAEKLAALRDLSLFVDEVANLIPDKRRPYVGSAAFAHKGGIHVSAIRKNPVTYEHIDPALVGNSQRFLVSDLSGESTILAEGEGIRHRHGEGQEGGQRGTAAGSRSWSTAASSSRAPRPPWSCS